MQDELWLIRNAPSVEVFEDVKLLDVSLKYRFQLPVTDMLLSR